MAPFAWQSNKAILFYFTQTLSPRFNSVSGSRGRIRLHPDRSTHGTVESSRQKIRPESAFHLAGSLQDTRGHRRRLNGGLVGKPQQWETQAGDKRPGSCNQSIHSGEKYDSTAVYGPYLDLALNKQFFNKMFEIAGKFEHWLPIWFSLLINKN